MKKIFLLILVLFLISCKKKELDLKGTSWYLYSSTDSTVNREILYKYYLSFYGSPYHLRIYHFSSNGQMIKKFFNISLSNEHLDSNKLMQKKWVLRNDTLKVDDNYYLVKAWSIDSLQLQMLGKNNQIKQPAEINTFYRIGI